MFVTAFINPEPRSRTRGLMLCLTRRNWDGFFPSTRVRITKEKSSEIKNNRSQEKPTFVRHETCRDGQEWEICLLADEPERYWG